MLMDVSGRSMIVLDDLAQVAEDLRKRGLDVIHDFLYSARGIVEGLDVGDDFFPRWELSLAENAEALERADFAAIKNRRADGWTIEPPVQPGTAVP
jgi:hypothetical protein